MNSTFTCPVQGQSDLYGLGIRIALYLQIASALISGLSGHILEVHRNIGYGVIVFILAISTVLFRLILHHEIEAVEVFPILSLLIVQLGVCRVPVWKNPITIFAYVGETICLLMLTTWFWFKGMDTLPRSCPDDYAFLFAKISIWHWFRKICQFASVISTVGGAVGVLVYLITLPALLYTNFHNLHKEPSRHKKGDFPDMGTGYFEIVFWLGIIVYVEMALKWNHISGVHSLGAPGQLMPFSLALAQLLFTFYRLGKHGLIQSVEEHEGYSREGDEDECPYEKDPIHGLTQSVEEHESYSRKGPPGPRKKKDPIPNGDIYWLDITGYGKGRQPLNPTVQLDPVIV